MVKWEYCWVFSTPRSWKVLMFGQSSVAAEGEGSDQILARLGQEGWELVTVAIVPKDGAYPQEFYLKRSQPS